MENALIPPARKRSRRPATLTFGKARNIFWERAWEALMLAFLVQIFGTIAFGLVSSLWSRMAPSLPPGFAGKWSEASWDFSFFHQYRFAVLFGLFYIAKVAGSFASYSRNEEHRIAAKWAKRFSRKLSEQWFGLVVMNAFMAFIAVMVLQITQQFSFAQWMWHLLVDLLRPAIDGIASLLSAGLVSGVKAWAMWYQANQSRFLFWLFYSAAICDDLGLPNYKTLCRFLWHWFAERKKKSVVAAAPPA